MLMMNLSTLAWRLTRLNREHTNISRFAHIVGDKRAHQVGQVLDVFSLFSFCSRGGHRFSRTGLAVSPGGASLGIIDTST